MHLLHEYWGSDWYSYSSMSCYICFLLSFFLFFVRFWSEKHFMFNRIFSHETANSITRAKCVKISEVSTFPIVVISFLGCAPEMFVAYYYVTYCIYIPGKPGIWFHYYYVVYDECKWSVPFWLEDRIRFFCTLHHLIIIIVQTSLKTLNL